MMISGFILLALGVAVYFFARHGFLVGTHPFCANCEFNLTGLPEERGRCPECGAEILREGAIRIGYRRPVLAGMLAGAVTGLVGVILMVMGVVAWWPTFDGSHFKPVAMLEREMNSPRDAVRAGACRELSRRLAAGSVSPADAQEIAVKILKWQVDPAMTWDAQWGDVVQATRRWKVLPDNLWQKYLQQAMQVTARVRPRVGRDDPLPIAIECRLKAGREYAALVPAIVRPEMQVIDGGKSVVLQVDGQSLDIVPLGLEWNALWMRDKGRNEAGKLSVRLNVAMAINAAGGTQATVSTVFDLPYEVLAAGQSLVALHAPANAQETAEMVGAFHWRWRAGNDGKVALAASGSSDFGTLWVAGQPVAVASRVMLRQGGREWPMARFMVRANDAVTVALRLAPAAPGDGPHAGAAQVVCVPETDLAVGTVDVMEVWGDEVRAAVEIEAAAER